MSFKSMQLHAVGSVVTGCLILSGCVTRSATNGPGVEAEAALDTSGISEVADKCGMIANGESSDNVLVLRASGGAEARCPAGTRFASQSPVCLQNSEEITILTSSGAKNLSGPGCFYAGNGSVDRSNSRRLSSFLSNRSTSRARTGAVRAAGSTAVRGAGVKKSAPSVDLGEVKVIRGTASALRRYKLKATILTGAEICLKKRESLTVLRKKGGLLNLKGPGCNVFRRSGEVVNVAGVSGGQ